MEDFLQSVVPKSDAESSDLEEAVVAPLVEGDPNDDDDDEGGILREPPIGAAISFLPWRRGRDQRDSESRELAPDACYTYVKDQNKPDFAGLLYDSSSESEESVRLQRDADEGGASVESEAGLDGRDGLNLKEGAAEDFDDNDSSNEQVSLFSRGAPPAHSGPGASDEGAFVSRQVSRQQNPLERLSRTLANWMEKDANGHFRRKWGPYQPDRDRTAEARLLDRVAELECMLEEQREMYEKQIRDLEEELQRLRSSDNGGGGEDGCGESEESSDECSVEDSRTGRDDSAATE